MTWWMIALLVLGYIIIGGIVAGVVTHVDTDYPNNDDVAFGILTGFVWPASIAISLVVAIGTLPFMLGKTIIMHFKGLKRRRNK